ncbi:MAG: hypothetical protein A2527_00895 [Candidatus Lambdaproteobacteria bacterium RIFOXYD2_FULL_50_16]|uniref:Baseplate protein J-like domain-containing protein n=1 Tax=Candidatus Lambdaproteobacteria bacterium RIFOXYD2_FULL_50_16 TaxID=1817772 RepID=A0A1F6G8V7_9PROT|nr:MAG: hypothetical protein A2527_00895 [Candidatus Lambdaproteobacteria bacterium RIFOXYD2_FULL_50_16]
MNNQPYFWPDNPGVTQEDRFAEGLRGNPFENGDQTLLCLVGQAWQLAEKLKYYGPNGSLLGNWQDLLTSHYLPILAGLAYQEPGDLVQQVKTQLKAKNHRQVFDLLLNQVEELVRWKILLSPWPASKVPNFPLTGLIRIMVRLHHLSMGLNLEPDQVKRVQSQYQKLGNSDFDSALTQYIEVEDLSYEPVLIAQDLAGLLLSLAQTAGACFEKSGPPDGSLPPHLALMFGFLETMANHDSMVTQLPNRQLDFYQRQVLGLQPRGAVPFKQWLSVQLVPGLKKIQLLPGLGYSKNQQKPYLVERETQANLGVCDQFWVLDLTNNKGAFGVEKIEIPASGVLDKTKKLLVGLGCYTPKIGLSLATPLFRLSGGQRTINLCLELTWPNKESLNRALTKISPRLGGESNGTWCGDPNLFICRATGPKGVVNLPKPTSVLSRGTSPNQLYLDLSLQIGADLPAIVAWQAGLHDPLPPANCPQLTLEYQEEIGLLVYQFFASAQMTRCQAKVEVVGLRDLILQTPLGVSAPGSPFLPFGALPSLNDPFIVGSLETFTKPLCRASLNWQWPDAPVDFSKHYQEYESAAPRGPITAEANWLVEGQWQSAGEPLVLAGRDTTEFKLDTLPLLKAGWQTFSNGAAYDAAQTNGFLAVKLTQPEDPFGQTNYPLLLQQAGQEVSKNQLIKFFLEPVLTFIKLLDVLLKPLLKLVDSIITGLFKVLDYTLGLPLIIVGIKGPISRLWIAFKKLLSKLCKGTASIWQQILHFLRGPDPEKIKPPYLPKFIDCSLNYSAHEDLIEANSTAQIFQLTPWGYQLCNKSVYWPQDYNEAGQFYWGLANQNPGDEVNLYLGVAKAPTPWTKEGGARPLWQYLTDSGWQTLLPKEEDENQTWAQLAEGILRFVLPKQASSGLGLMPPGRMWIRAKLPFDPKEIGPLTSIYSQVVPLIEGVPQGLDLAQIPELGRLTLIGPPKGGRGPESAESFVQRVAERLHHKGRALTPGDFERLVLVRFPEVGQVKAIPHFGADLSPKRGTLLLVLSAGVGELATGDLPLVEPRLLSQVEAYLKKHLPEMGKIAVCNPAIEQVQIRAKLRLSDPDLVPEIQEGLAQWLTPWRSGAERLGFGEPINCNDLVHFFSAQPGVIAVKEVIAELWVKGSKVKESAELIYPTSPASLVLPGHSLLSIEESQ